MKEFCFKKDDDCHWYLIPLKLAKKFDSICAASYANDKFDIFDELFGNMRIDSPFQFKFTDPKEFNE